MFLSLGNIAQYEKLGLLFISFERPHRLRVQGTASVSQDDPLMAQYKEADFIVCVKLTELWQNCPRYIHRFEKATPSRYVPRDNAQTPLAQWTRIDLINDTLPDLEVAAVKAEGTMEIGEWIGKVKSGDPSA